MLAVINIIADMIVLVLPMPYIYRLQLATYKKVTLLFTFGVGFMYVLTPTTVLSIFVIANLSIL